ncbi:MAG: outer membrane beta-barrel protein [Kiritimatiellales bacterium]|jgi:hypothetical protein
MKKIKILIPVLVGLLIGQLFADNERPLSVINTVRMGYNDNLYHRDSGESSGSFFMTDIVDLSFRAALSDRTDFMAKSQINLMQDDGGTEFYPNLYAMLNHSVSSRLLLGLSEYYRSGDRSGEANTSDKNARFNYFNNRAGASADYVLTSKDRIQGTLDYEILRNEDDVKSGLNNDTTTIKAGTSWKRDIILQRTYSTLNLREYRVEYDHMDSSYDATEMSAELSHAFNQQWQGNLEGGVTQKRPDFQGTAENKDTLNPLVNAGLVYSPSPRTRFSGDFSYRYEASNFSGFGGQTEAKLRFGAQHDITAKLMAKATASFAKISYDENDRLTSTATSRQDDLATLDLRLSYKLNRINFIELGMRHSERTSDNGSDWKQNVVDIGWRVELN